ncbi:MAG: helix-turn-helix transcriptional regulator [Parasphingorhabdus sp.]
MSISLRHQIEKIHDRVIAEGVPTTYGAIMREVELSESDFAAQIAKKVAASGIRDELIVPVYGPFKIEGCMCFGFEKSVRKLKAETREALEILATSSHVKIVSTFRDKINKVDLSKRETQVLRWLALGKSQSDIATILDIKATTVDSYTRRIYAKLGVNTKIAAVLAGISTGKISI